MNTYGLKIRGGEKYVFLALKNDTNGEIVTM